MTPSFTINQLRGSSKSSSRTQSMSNDVVVFSMVVVLASGNDVVATPDSVVERIGAGLVTGESSSSAASKVDDGSVDAPEGMPASVAAISDSAASLVPHAARRRAKSTKDLTRRVGTFTAWPAATRVAHTWTHDPSPAVRSARRYPERWISSHRSLC